jgi:hypothetical protein
MLLPACIILRGEATLYGNTQCMAANASVNNQNYASEYSQSYYSAWDYSRNYGSPDVQIFL